VTAAIEQRLKNALGATRVQRDAPLAPVTTFKVGGTADWLVQARSREDISRALEIAREFELPVTVLGGGSNVLIADAGSRGPDPRRGGHQHRR
jgi:UDP-N-acetylmuramate dehydrogenase